MSDTEQRFEREMQGPITFQRPDPTQFVLLVARVGPGTTNVDPKLAHKFGAAAFKPAGTDYATDKDMRDAGYVPIARVSEMLGVLDVAAKEILDHLDDPAPERDKRLRALSERMSKEVHRDFL